MYPSPVIDLETFVPAKDPELSKKFYTDLGASDWFFPIPAADLLRRRACGQFHDEPASSSQQLGSVADLNGLAEIRRLPHSCP